MDVSRYRLQNIVRSRANALNQQRLPLHHIKALESIAACRSGELGTSYYQCAERHGTHEQHHSCRHRSCYLCSLGQKHHWVESQQKRLLNCAHFHLVFTLPSEYRVLWMFNTAWFTRALFASVQETVIELMRDDRFHGVVPGLLLTLHTWGRQLNLHPHIHGLITAGGLDRRGEWHDTDEFLLPIRLVKSLYRGKLQSRIKDAFSQGELALPPDLSPTAFLKLHRSAYRKPWSVRVEEQYSHGKGVLLYLSKYMKGGPINPAQIERCNAKEIAFRYKDHRDKRVKCLSLEPKEFVRRLLLHVPASGVHTVRHYGLYSSAGRAKRNRCRELFGDLAHIELAPSEIPKDMVVLLCRTCGDALRLCYRSGRKKRKKGISLIEHGARDFVQQGDESDRGNVLRHLDPCYSSG